MRKGNINITIALLWLNIYLEQKLVTLMRRFDLDTAAEKLHIYEKFLKSDYI